MGQNSQIKQKSKPRFPRTRTTIVDQNGWTHIASRRGNSNLSQVHDQLIPAEIPSGLTIEKLTEQFIRHKKMWQESQTWKALESAILRTTDRTSMTTITATWNCVCIALGSPSGLLRGGHVDRRGISLFQLAALVSILEVLADLSNISGKCFAQDPVFNELDRELLNSLGFEVVNGSKAFELVHESTFLYAPGAERIHLLTLLPLNPQIFFGGPLDTSHSIIDLENGENEQSVLTNFTRKMQSINLSEFNPNPASFWRSSFYWRSSSNQASPTELGCSS
ncbi:hypothetical protein FQN57_002161 [Myotisia sp. PD_48]|nr:hypothetical protein FQN57_002161 [Myotisia sp. PD_48]